MGWDKFACVFPSDRTIHGVPTTAPRPPQKQRLESAKVRRPLSEGVGGNSLPGCLPRNTAICKQACIAVSLDKLSVNSDKISKYC